MPRMLPFGIAMLGLAMLDVPATAVAQPGGFSGDRMFGFMDRDQSGVLEPDELERMPGPFREWMTENDVEFSRGIARDDFVELMPRMMESLRNQRESDRGSDDSDEGRRRGFGGFSRGGYGRGDEDRESSSSRSDSKDESKERARVTLSLQAAYTAGDLDRDGQIAFYEWKQWKGRGALLEFQRLDLNGDGFVTPRELALIESGKAGERTVVSSVASSIVSAVNANPASVAAPASTAAGSVSTIPAGTAPPAEESREARQGRTYFKLMDNDRNGTITPEEWDRSRRLKPMFEAVEIDLSQPMNETQFVEGYVKAMAKGS